MKVDVLEAKELADWRTKRDIASSPAGKGSNFAPGWHASPVQPGEVSEPAKAPPPRSGSATLDSTLNFMWSNMTRDRDSYTRAVAWLRARTPHAVSHLTDAQLLDHLRMLARDATTRTLARKKLLAPLRLDGRNL